MKKLAFAILVAFALPLFAEEAQPPATAPNAPAPEVTAPAAKEQVKPPKKAKKSKKTKKTEEQKEVQ
ncbi:MAG: hypothetical protein HY537_06350 [Deltaproteobacteria bacterium]|nr:hypothetical protein [Deltaproteobacteria bacterium]